MRDSRADTMRALVLLLVFLARSEALKCCPEGQILLKESGLYACLTPEDANVTDAFPLHKGRSHSHIRNGFPECDSESWLEKPFASQDLLPTNHCVDKLFEVSINETTSSGVISLTCQDDASVGNGWKMKSVTKCCRDNQVYDILNHICVDGFTSSHLYDFLGEDTPIVDIKYSMIPCHDPRVLYQYTRLDYEFKMDGDTLKMRSLSNSDKSLTLKPGSYCMDDTLQSTLVVRTCRDTCEDGPCISKCCPQGQLYRFDQANCSKSPPCQDGQSPFPLVFHDISNQKSPIAAKSPHTVGIRYGMTCYKYRLDPSDPDDANYLDVATGHLLIPSLGSNPLQKAYCMELVENQCRNMTAVMYRFACFPPSTDTNKTLIKKVDFSVYLFISCFFLALTLLVYLLLPPLRNLHGKTLMCHVTAMLFSYLCLARVQMGAVPLGFTCKLLGYFLYFGFLSAFAWLNIMCVDIWWTFGNMRSVQEMGRNKDWKKFLKYSSYGWGFPIVMTIITYLIDQFDVLPGWLDPNMGFSQCWFSQKFHAAPWLILFILPVGMMIGINVILFVLTVIYCNKVKSEIRRMQSGSMGDRCKKRFTADRAKLTMNLKLFVVMGVFWIMEIISSLIENPPIVWHIADLINVLQGIPIFCILVLKKKVYLLIKKRLGYDEVTRRVKSERTTSTALTNSLIDSRKASNVPLGANKSVNGALIPKSP